MQPLPPSELPRAVGITTTIPCEILFAAGLRPVDLNNVFIASGEAGALVAEAERDGFPRASCAWAKGCYAAAKRLGLRRVVVVTEGDCSNTHALGELLSADGVEVAAFAFPYGRDRQLLRLHLARFAEAMGCSLADAEAWKRRLDPVRALAHRVDELCWAEHKVRGDEAHVWQISCSDFDGDPDVFAERAKAFLAEAGARPPDPSAKRVALAGVPPICEGLFDLLESHGARVVFNEVPRQFTMPEGGADLVEQYARYTYPYDIFRRAEDVAAQVRARKADGVLHYVQSFCYRQVQDVLLRRGLDVPVLTLEYDRPGPLDAAARTRIEAFVEMLPGRGE